MATSRGNQFAESLLVYIGEVMLRDQSADICETRVVSDYQDVFQNIPGLPRVREVEFYIKFLGHIVSREGIAVDPAKVSIVIDWEPPKMVTKIHSFLGLAGYYRKFIQDFLKVVISLTCLMMKGV
ncbi:uncharacterized protein LOC109847614 [Asparagus officinalis]|uniref:uncharacterized protein LOC109847614 n=1 Tax=Asparagus officinalis TaxID=4686 RepID=UPI00098E6781|nr:uncharacterized protein LOC109847614 [Asparagus officinalis]